KAGDVECVPGRGGVLGAGAGVEDAAAGEALEPVQPLDEIAVVVGVKEACLEAVLSRGRRDPPLERIELQLAVVSGIAAAELVEVDAVHHFDPVAYCHSFANSLTAACRAPGCTAQPGRAA